MGTPSGITITASADITDYLELGRTIANANSEEQALFLIGLQAGFKDMAGSSAMQMHYVADELARAGENVHQLIDRLSEYLGADQ